MIKRLFDIFFSFIAIICIFPLILVIVLLLKVSSRGPVFFTQERIGKCGRPFRIIKFRTMIVDAEEKSAPVLAEADDDRLTKPGAFLRAHHLDELPQLWNVLVGDMSFVGYRPERKFFIDQIMERNPRYEELYKIRPGITSYATLYNGYTDTMEKMLRRLDLDLYYLEHQSLWYDLKIIGKTILSIAKGKKF